MLKSEYAPYESIPCRVWVFKSRWSRLIIYIAACIFTSNVLLGWQQMSTILFDSGAYGWKCPADYSDNEPCPPQYAAVQSIYTVFIASQASGSVVAGVLYDNLGPMLTAFIGEACQLLGWLSLAFSNKSVQLYIPAGFLLGVSVNVVSYPTLVLADIFPKHPALMTSMIVAMQSAAAIVPIVLEAIFQRIPNYRALLLGYTLLFVFPCFVIFPLSCPYDRLAAVAACSSEKRLGTSKEERNDEEAKSRLEVSAADADTPSTVVQCTPERLADGTVSEIELKSLSGVPDGLVAEVVEKKDSGQGTDWRQLGRELTSQKWLLFTLYYVVQVLIDTYYPTTTRAMFGVEVSMVFGYIFPAQAITGTLIGLAVELYGGVLPTTLAIALLLSLVYGLGLTHILALHYLSTVLFTIADSYVYVTKFTYFQEAFPPRNFGFLVGLTGTLSGIIAFANIPFVNLGNFPRGYLIYLVTGLVNSLLIVYLWVYSHFEKKRKV